MRRKGQVYISEDYPDVKVQVWGVDRTADPELKRICPICSPSSEIEKKDSPILVTLYS